MSYKWSEDAEDGLYEPTKLSRALRLEQFERKSIVLETSGLIAFSGGWVLFSPEIVEVFKSASTLNIEISGLCWTYSITTGRGGRQAQQMYTGHTKNIEKRIRRHANALPMDKSNGWQCWITLHTSEERAIADEIATIKYSVRENICHVLNIQHASDMTWEVAR
jgi:predicted GIY-YIG superfamily endonuclease